MQLPKWNMDQWCQTVTVLDWKPWTSIIFYRFSRNTRMSMWKYKTTSVGDSFRWQLVKKVFNNPPPPPTIEQKLMNEDPLYEHPWQSVFLIRSAKISLVGQKWPYELTASKQRAQNTLLLVCGSRNITDWIY